MQFQKYGMVPLEVMYHANVGRWDCPTKIYRFLKKYLLGMENGTPCPILLLSKNTCVFGMSIQFIYLNVMLESLFGMVQKYL